MTDSTMPGRELRTDATSDSPVRSVIDGTGVATAGSSAVSWSAILAGAAGAAALSLILLILGTGLGLASVSPFSGRGASATTFGASTIAWLTFMQLAASGMGGYLAGRLRTRWQSTHTDEVYFRDTAHGFLAWAVATLATAALLTSTIGSIVGAGANAAGVVAGGAGTAAAAAAPAASAAARFAGTGAGGGYFVDSLFRKDVALSTSATTPAPADTTSAPPAAEAGRIFASGLEAGSLPQEDVRYLGQTVAQRTGLPQAEAEKRVTDNFARMKDKVDHAKAQAREAADKARKASAYSSLWLFVSLLVGAFVAAFMATFGGRLRDRV